nr:MAG TPA: hypothetical protein [Microviridae sp.]
MQRVSCFPGELFSPVAATPLNNIFPVRISF